MTAASLAARITAASSNTSLEANSSSTPSSTAAASMGPSDLSIVWDVDIFLLSLIALLFVLRLPRFLARLYKFSEWTNGLYLRNKPYLKRTAGRRVQFSSGLSSKDFDSLTTKNDEVRAQRANQGPHPIHIPNCISIFRPMLKMMHARINPGVSFSHIVIMAVWLGTIVFPAFYMSKGPFTDPVRFGWITASQLPFVYAFGTKNNVLGMLLGIGYEKINFLHRHSARIVLISVNVHGLGFIYKWCLASEFMKEIAKPKCHWGLIGLICIDCLFVFSTGFFRKNAYWLFISTHVSALVILVVAMLKHYAGVLPWAYACAAIYLFDVLLRVLKTRFSRATLRPIPELGVTYLEVPNVNSGWRAGQHVRLRVISSGMGLAGWLETHPFTIASVADSPEGGLVLFCKKAGDWTNRLYDIASSSSSEDTGRRVLVTVQGPYGGLGNCMVSSFSAAVFICGGSGITFATSMIQELIQNDLDDQSRVKSIDLIWIVQEASALIPMLPLFTSMIQESLYTPVRISVFYTRARTGKTSFPDDSLQSTSLTLSPGRPDIHQHLEECISRVSSSNLARSEGLFVGVCGPVPLADAVFAAAGEVSPHLRDQIGGVEVHSETFGW